MLQLDQPIGIRLKGLSTSNDLAIEDATGGSLNLAYGPDTQYEPRAFLECLTEHFKIQARPIKRFRR
jgi:hypothetical protein